MARPPAETLTPREAQVMDAVWRLGEVTADQVRESLPEPLHDSTVRTLLRVLETKGYLHHEARGKAYVYRAAVERKKAQRHALRSVLAQVLRRVGRGPGVAADRGRADHPRAARRICAARPRGRRTGQEEGRLTMIDLFGYDSSIPGVPGSGRRARRGRKATVLIALAFAAHAVLGRRRASSARRLERVPRRPAAPARSAARSPRIRVTVPLEARPRPR